MTHSEMDHAHREQRLFDRTEVSSVPIKVVPPDSYPSSCGCNEAVES
jgi:hypothetical protein